MSPSHVLRPQKLGDVMALVQQFEECTLPAPAWDHSAQLTVSLWYLLHQQEEWQATELLIRAVRRYCRVHGQRVLRDGGYHETRTVFWLAIARRYLKHRKQGGSALDLIQDFLAEYGANERLILEHYRSATLRSCEARYFWVEPDLRPLA